jgi:hypothetical protein
VTEVSGGMKELIMKEWFSGKTLSCGFRHIFDFINYSSRFLLGAGNRIAGRLLIECYRSDPKR